MIKWIFLLRFPEGVSEEEGSEWYLRVHTQEVKGARGLVQYRTWPLEPIPEGIPGSRKRRWVRLTEAVFHDWDAYRESMSIDYTPAPWAPEKPGFIAETISVSVDPQFDLLHDGIPEQLP